MIVEKQTNIGGKKEQCEGFKKLCDNEKEAKL